MINLPSDLLRLALSESPALLDYVVNYVIDNNNFENKRSWSVFEEEIVDVFRKQGKVLAVKHVLEKSRNDAQFFNYFAQKYATHPKKDFIVPEGVSFTLGFSKFIVEDLCC